MPCAVAAVIGIANGELLSFYFRPRRSARIAWRSSTPLRATTAMHVLQVEIVTTGKLVALRAFSSGPRVGQSSAGIPTFSQSILQGLRHPGVLLDFPASPTERSARHERTAAAEALPAIAQEVRRSAASA